MPSPLTRREVLRGGLSVTAGVVAVSAFAACDRGPSSEQTTAEALLPLANAASADQAAASALAPRTPEYARALGLVAQQRGDHARALREEITRLDQEVAKRLAPPSPNGAPAPGPAPTAGNVDALRERLRTSGRAAADAATSLRGYSAGLAGAISAALTTMVEVQLR